MKINEKKKIFFLPFLCLGATVGKTTTFPQKDVLHVILGTKFVILFLFISKKHTKSENKGTGGRSWKVVPTIIQEMNGVVPPVLGLGSLVLTVSFCCGGEVVVWLIF